MKCEMLTTDDFHNLCEEWLTSTRFHHVVTLTSEMVVAAETDSSFRQAVMAADIRVPDGSGLIWAHWYLRSDFWSLFFSLVAFLFRTAHRVTGVDTVLTISRLAVKANKPVYLLGGTASQVTKTAEKLRRLVPGLAVTCAPDHQFDLAGPAHIVADIQAKAPAVLFVAYGAPKQTVWIEKHRQDLSNVRIAVGVGGAFAMLSEEKPRAPKFLRKLNLEWLWRLILEPSRLPRIWQATVEFPRLIARQKIQTKQRSVG